jgi:hypothetical protein
MDPMYDSYGDPVGAALADIDVNVKMYSNYEAHGVIVLVVAGVLSMVSVIGLFVVLAISARNSRKNPEENAFIRTHVAAYFISLLICDFGQTIGAMLNLRWLAEMGVHTGGYCTAQGVIKQFSNVGTALWSLVIAIHTFNLLFLRFQAGKTIFYCTLFGVWSLLGVILLIGPAALVTPAKGPFYGISGYWCWMTPQYPVERYALEYGFMFLSSGGSFILYFLVFLRLRGNISLDGWRWKFRAVKKEKTWAHEADSQMMSVARQMMWYPVGYMCLVLPIASSRFSEWAGARVPFEVTIFSAAVFMLSGFVNAILFTATRRVVPVKTIVPSFIRSRPNGNDTSTQHSSSEKYNERSFMHASEIEAQTHRVIDISAVRKEKEIPSARPPVRAHGSMTSSFHSGGSEFEQVMPKQQLRDDRGMQNVDLGAPRPGRQ